MVEKSSQYYFGFTDMEHRGELVRSTLNSAYQNLLPTIEDKFEYEVGVVPAGFEHRPDLISEVFYNTPEYWWLLLVFNNITDPYEGLNVGDRILIPTI